MPSDILKIEISQGAETDVRCVPYRNIKLRYTYARASDSQVSNQLGQDYLEAWLGESESGRLKFAFAVCDGVGSSFMGNLAAKMLGSYLCRKMWGRAISFSPPRNPEQVVQRLTLLLNDYVDESDQIILQYRLPETLPGLTRRALDEQRQYGSESMFVSGMLLSEHLILTWLGDARLQVLTEELEPLDGFVQVPDTNCRWSSQRGVRGEIQARVIPPEQLELVKHILAFTDGLSLAEKRLASSSDEELNATVKELGKLPTSDDIALVHFML